MPGMTIHELHSRRVSCAGRCAGPCGGFRSGVVRRCADTGPAGAAGSVVMGVVWVGLPCWCRAGLPGVATVVITGQDVDAGRGCGRLAPTPD